MKIIVYSQKLKKSDHQYVVDLLDACNQLGISICIFEPYHRQIVSAGLTSLKLDTFNSYEELKSYHPDLVVTMGGDGTILNAIHVVKDTGVPILGVNLGRLGFLSNIEKTKIKEALKEVYEGKYYTEERTMLSLGCNLPIFESLPYALNDFTISKRDTSSMITIHTYLDGQFLNSYWADGLVVSTPTGSTGYSLSCGGPIIFPNSGNLVITPVAPHNLNVRPVVISDKSELTFEIEGRSENFLCTMDSRFETITSEHKISIRKSDFTIKLAHPNDISFMNTIREKLMWGIDKRNH